jgi:hypothetical protein
MLGRYVTVKWTAHRQQRFEGTGAIVSRALNVSLLIYSAPLDACGARLLKAPTIADLPAASASSGTSSRPKCSSNLAAVGTSWTGPANPSAPPGEAPCAL